jgi:hypothetical protein
MVLAARMLILSAVVFTSCTTAKHAAVTTFHVIDTPARYVRDRIDPPEGTSTTTTTTQTTGTSDVVTPGRPVTPTTTQRSVATGESKPPTPTDTASSTTRSSQTASTMTQPKPSATPRPSQSAPPQFPTAKPVPGKPGFVYSLDSNGGMVDVTGYKSGDKAKDPYTHQIFVVP